MCVEREGVCVCVERESVCVWRECVCGERETYRERVRVCVCAREWFYRDGESNRARAGGDAGRGFPRQDVWVDILRRPVSGTD